MKTLGLCLLCASVLGQAQERDIISRINDTIASLPYVFEGHVEGVEIYPADDQGNRLPMSSAKWNGNVAHFFDAQGNRAYSFTSATITVCRAYKGDLPKRIIMVSKVPGLSLDARIENGDTTFGFIKPRATHRNSYAPMLPSKGYPIRKLFFVERLEQPTRTDFTGKREYSSMQIYYEAPMDLLMSDDKPDGSAEAYKAYAVIYPHVLRTQEELSELLGKINGLEANPEDRCKGKRTEKAEKKTNLQRP